METDSYNRIPYSSAQQRRHSFVLRSSRLPMKSNPYVGSFRHAPPAAASGARRSSCSTIRKATSLPVFKANKYTFNNNAQLRIPSTLPRQMKNSPHVGWFRHAPPSRLSSTATTTTTSTSMTSQQNNNNNNWEQNLSTILETITSRLNQETDKIKQKTAAAARTTDAGDIIENRKIIIVVDGHLPGGNPANNCDDDAGDDNDGGRYGGYGERSLVSALPLFSAFGSVIGETFHQSLHDMSLFLQETSIVSTSATISVLCRLAYWFLFPLAHDAATSGDCSAASSSSKSKSITSGTINVMDLFPYMFPVTYKRLFKNKKCGTASSSNSKEDNSNDDDDDELDSLSSLPSSSGLSEISDDLGLSLSSLAEAYYAHQAAQEVVNNVEAAAADDEEPPDQQQQQQQAPYSSPLITDQPLLHHDDEAAGGHDHLDYMISQMDVARMAKNASRHLDVESILSLPTITYKSESPPLTTPFSAAANHKQHQARRQGRQEQQQQQYERTEEEGWSWMIVPPSSSQATTSPDDIIDDNSSYNGGESQQQQRQQQQEQQGDTSCTVATTPPPPLPNNDQDNKDLCCVICLDKFVDGDRLRVLPCNHMFHMGCIDRWLSGTDDSHYECITSGCPTCKKHPSSVEAQAQSGGVISDDDSQQQQGTNSSEDQTAQQEAGGITILEPAAELEDGSVPSWAYTRIGETLALSQSGLTSDF